MIKVPRTPLYYRKFFSGLLFPSFDDLKFLKWDQKRGKNVLSHSEAGTRSSFLEEFYTAISLDVGPASKNFKGKNFFKNVTKSNADVKNICYI